MIPSGTSGGGISAALAWRGLIAGGPAEAVQRISRFWHDLSARKPGDFLTTVLDVWQARTPVVINASPYLTQFIAEPTLRLLLRSHLQLEQLAGERRGRSPKLFIGATDVLNSERMIFEGETLTYDDLVASGAVPPLFRAVLTKGRRCWDGLFTTNPPIRELTSLEQRPDEIWIVQITPQHRSREPRRMREIKDRSNEISGNLSLGQELYFIDKINHLLKEHPSLSARYRSIRLRVVELDSEHLDYPSKLDRRAAFIDDLMEQGKQRAEWFFDSRSEWPRPRTPPARSLVGGNGAAADEAVHSTSDGAAARLGAEP